jgi:ABC-type metal ion transport system substrate-binding protein
MNNSHIKDKLHAIVQHNTLIKDNMKTAVEWLVEELTKQNMFMHLFAKEIEQAKEMEKEQIIDAYQTSHISMMTAEQYYNENYKNKEQ